MRKHTSSCIFCLVVMAATSLAQWTEPELLPAPINLNPPGEYYYSTISADGEVLALTISPGFYGDDDVYLSERIGDTAWTVPVNAGPNVNNGTRNLSPSITSDRQRLYYVSFTGTTYRIFASHRTGPAWDDWSQGETLPAPIHRGNEFTAQIGYDDSTLVYTSTYRPDTVPIFGDNVMYTSRLRPDSSWSEPHLIAPHLNLMNGSFHPCLTDSGSTLVYGQFGGQHWDIFYAFRNDTGFGPAYRCDSTINTPEWDSSPSCPVDGSYLVFDSRRDTSINGAARLYIAQRVGNVAAPRPRHTHSSLIHALTARADNTQITLSLSGSLPAELKNVSIHDILGRTVYRGAIRFVSGERSSQGILQVGVLPAGVYFAQVEFASQTLVAKFVIL